MTTANTTTRLSIGRSASLLLARCSYRTEGDVSLQSLLERVKACPRCGEQIAKKEGESPWQYNRRRFCSRVCGSRASNRARALTAEQKIRQTTRVSESGCWIWTDKPNQSGYGKAVIGGKLHLAHRLSYETFVGLIPDDLLVCHKCDDRLCVNPDHLFLGTNADNTADRNAKSRQAKGEGSGRARLTEEDVRAIRASGDKYADLATRYGVGETTISHIKARRSWRHI